MPVQIDRGSFDLLLEVGRTGDLEETGVRETFANFHIEAVKTRYSISGAKKQEAAEVLISNFKRVA